jgi:hypothetical protein
MSSTGWTTVRLSRLNDPTLIGKTMRVLSRVIGPDLRQHLVPMAQGPYGGPVRDADGSLYVDVLPDPGADLVDEQQRELAREIHARRAADKAAGKDVGRELWGPLSVRNVLQIRDE